MELCRRSVSGKLLAGFNGELLHGGHSAARARRLLPTTPPRRHAQLALQLLGVRFVGQHQHPAPLGQPPVLFPGAKELQVLDGGCAHRAEALAQRGLIQGAAHVVELQRAAAGIAPEVDYPDALLRVLRPAEDEAQSVGAAPSTLDRLPRRRREVMQRLEPPQERLGPLRTPGAVQAAADSRHEHLLRLSLGRAVHRGEVWELQRAPESGLVVRGDGDLRMVGS